MKVRIMSLALVGVLLGGVFEIQVCPAQGKKIPTVGTPVAETQAPPPQVVSGVGIGDLPVGLREKIFHGDKLVIEMNNSSKKVGTLVWGNADYLVVRTEAGKAPEKIMHDDIKELNRIRPASFEDKGSGGIKPAIQGEAPRSWYPTEIQTVTVHNGPNSYSTFFGPTLSSKEKAELDRLDQANQAVAKAQVMLAEAQRMLNNAANLENQKAEALAAFYQNSRLYSLGFRTPPILAETGVNYGASGYGTGYYGGGYGYGYGFGFGHYYDGQSLETINRYGDYPQPNPVAGVFPGASSEDLAKLAMSAQKDANEMLAQARKEADQSRSLALYSTDGRLIAVRTWE